MIFSCVWHIMQTLKLKSPYAAVMTSIQLCADDFRSVAGGDQTCHTVKKKKKKGNCFGEVAQTTEVVCIVFLFIQVTPYRSDGISDQLKPEADVLKVKPRNAFRRDCFNVEKLEFPLSRIR